ncbi:MAG: hypothetical protein WCA29_10145 [Jiangellales bacterium]
MAVVLLRLKLSLQRRSRGRGGAAQRVWFVVGWLLALVLGTAAGAALAAADSARDSQSDLGVLLVFTGVFVGWLLFPVVLPGLADQTVDPEKLEQFPITARDQVAGLLLGGLVAPTALFTFLLAAGGTVAAGESWASRLAALVAAITFTVLCVAGSRTVQALLAGAMRSRRGRDLTVAASGVLGLGIYLLSQNAHDLTGALVGLESSAAEGVLAWLPAGAAGQSLLDARDENWGAALAHLTVALAAIAGFVLLWMWAIRRRVQGSAGRDRPARSKESKETDLELIPVPLSAVRPSVGVAAAAQQLRYLLRSPQALQGALFPLVIGAVLGHSTVGDSGLVLGTLFFALLTVGASAVSANVFGFDDRGYSYLLAVGAPLRPVLTGKALIPLVLLVPAVGVFVVVESLLTDQWAAALSALLVGSAVLLVGSGVGAVMSVWAPQNRVSPKANRGRALVAAFGGLLAIALVAAILGVAWSALSDSVDDSLLALVTLGISVALCWVLIRWAGRRLTADPWAVKEMLGV